MAAPAQRPADAASEPGGSSEHHVGSQPPGPPRREAEEEDAGAPTGSTAASDEPESSAGDETERSEAERSEAERSDGERSDAGRSEEGECTDDTDGADSEASDEEPAEEILSLARVDGAPAQGEAEAPPPSAPPVSSPDEHLPVRTGIAVPMLVNPPTFIRSVPPQPELLYTVPEALFDDIVRQEADRVSRPELVRNRTVYDSVEAQAAAVPGEELPPYYAPTGPEDQTLVFESRFECGNLRRAVQVYEYEYDLILNPDYNTKSHTQWYFFRVSNTRKGPSYRFNLINMVKPTSVYNEGMRPLRYSSVEAAENGVGWVRCGEHIAYYQNGIRRREKGNINYYTLTFTVEFQHDCDAVYFSHCYPYSYTDLQHDLRELERDPNMARRFRRRKLCETLAGNACDLVTITSFCSDPSALRARRAVVVTARVHPGESNASWVMKGMLDYLTGPSLDARILRDNFVFKIIPMLNPDGVIVGNYRCSLAGQDLNRLWGDPSRQLHPTIFFAKSMFRHLLDDRETTLFIDIHGHSRKKNVFMYGNSEGTSIREKVFPGLLCRSSDCFSFDDCCFKIQKSKESTARVVAYRELSVVNAFTLEASFCGADFGPLADQHFNTRHLEEMGHMVCDAILDFCDPDQTKVMQVCKELQLLFPDDGNSDDVSDSEVDDATLRARRRKGRKAKREQVVKKKRKTGRPDGPRTALPEPDSPTVDGIHAALDWDLRRGHHRRLQGGRWREAEDAQALQASSAAATLEATLGAFSDVERWNHGPRRVLAPADGCEAAQAGELPVQQQQQPPPPQQPPRRARKTKRKEQHGPRSSREGGTGGGSAAASSGAGGGSCASQATVSAQGSRSQGELRTSTEQEPREGSARASSVFPPLSNNRRHQRSDARGPS